MVHQWRCLVYRRMTSFHDHPQDSSSRRVSSSPVDNSFLFYISIYLGYLFSRSFSRTKFKFFSRHAHMAIDAAIGRESKKKRSGGSFTSFFLFISPSLFCSLCIKQIFEKSLGLLLPVSVCTSLSGFLSLFFSFRLFLMKISFSLSISRSTFNTGVSKKYLSAFSLSKHKKQWRVKESERIFNFCIEKIFWCVHNPKSGFASLSRTSSIETPR